MGLCPHTPTSEGVRRPRQEPPRRIRKIKPHSPSEGPMRRPSDSECSEEEVESQCDFFRIPPKIRPYNRPISHEKNQTHYIALLAKISPICAPYNAHNRAIAAVFRPLFPVSIKYPFGMRSVSKTRLRERFNSPDCQNKAYSGLFLKRSPIRAPIGSRKGDSGLNSGPD